jgi:hypothetical protein
LTGNLIPIINAKKKSHKSFSYFKISSGIIGLPISSLWNNSWAAPKKTKNGVILQMTAYWIFAQRNMVRSPYRNSWILYGCYLAGTPFPLLDTIGLRLWFDYVWKWWYWFIKKRIVLVMPINKTPTGFSNYLIRKNIKVKDSADVLNVKVSRHGPIMNNFNSYF